MGPEEIMKFPAPFISPVFDNMTILLKDDISEERNYEIFRGKGN